MSFGQNEIVPIIIEPDYNHLYRFHSNSVELSEISSNTHEYTIECSNCTIEYPDEKDNGLAKNQFIVKPARQRTVVINILDITKDSSIVNSYEYKVVNFLDPYIFLNGTQSGGSCNAHAELLSARHSHLMPLKTTYEIKRWTMFIDASTIEGEGNELSDNARELLRTTKSGTKVSFNCVTYDSSGIGRLIGGTFTLE